MKVIIVGGVAGGASCAARLRRLDEKAEILMVERGPYVSYANCGLPYHVGGVIEKESSLLVANAKMFRDAVRHRRADQLRGDRDLAEKKTVDLRNVATGEVTTEPYDKLVLSPGALSVRPPLPGIDLPGIFHVRTVPDARAIREWIETRHAVPHGHAPLLGIPDGEAKAPRGRGRRRLHRPRDGGEPRPSRVRSDPGRDARSGAGPARPRRSRASSRAMLSGTASAWRSMTAWPDSSQPAGGALEVQTKSGKTYPADIVILALGVRPDTDAGQDGRPRDRRARRHPRRRADAHQRPGHLRRRRRHRGQGLRHRANGAWSRSPGPRTGRAASQPM